MTFEHLHIEDNDEIENVSSVMESKNLKYPHEETKEIPDNSENLASFE